MTAPITNLKAVRQRIQNYLVEERPLNLQEMDDIQVVLNGVITDIEVILRLMPKSAVTWQTANTFNHLRQVTGV